MNSETHPSIRIFPDPQALARALAKDWVTAVDSVPDRPFCVALSGGNTPRLLFRELSRPAIVRSIAWNRVHIFWGDERCVAADHPDSNFKMAWEGLLKFVPIAQQQIHRIRGEADPVEESMRYAAELRQTLDSGERFPRFDLILLGVGSDGHTASLFPEMKGEIEPSGLCTVVQHPETGQHRISLTMELINRAHRVTFLVTGAEKAGIVSAILKDPEANRHLPAAQVHGQHVQWMLDQQASSKLEE